MKKNFKFLSIVVITILFTFAGCKKDTEKPLIVLLIAKWEMQSVYYQFYENGIKTGENYDTFGPNNIVYEFLENGDGNIYENGTLKNPFTWTLYGTSVTIEKPEEVITGEVSIVNDILTFNGSYTYSAGGVNYEDLKTFTFKKV